MTNIGNLVMPSQPVNKSQLGKLNCLILVCSNQNISHGEYGSSQPKCNQFKRLTSNNRIVQPCPHSPSFRPSQIIRNPLLIGQDIFVKLFILCSECFTTCDRKSNSLDLFQKLVFDCANTVASTQPVLC